MYAGVNVYLNEYVCISYCIYSLYLFNVCYMPLTNTLGIPVHFIKFYSILFYSIHVTAEQENVFIMFNFVSLI